VYLGETLRTGNPGRVRIVFQDDSVLNVGDSSEVVIDEQVFDPGAGTHRSSFSLLRGKLRALVSEYYSSPGAAYEIETPTAVAGVRGTEFVLSFDERLQRTEVVGVTGQVAVRNLQGRQADEVLITAREVTTVERGQRPSAPRRMEDERFRQHLDGLEFVGQGRPESLASNHPIVGGAGVPAADRAPLWNAGILDGGERDASSLLEQPPELIERLEGGLSIRF